MNQLIDDVRAFVARQPLYIQSILTAYMLLVLLNQSMAAGESFGKALYRLLH